MTPQEKDKILDEITSKYKKQADTLGVMVFGSFIRGDFDKYSDIDIYVLKLNNPLYSREGYMLGGVRIDVTIDSEKEAKRLLKLESNSVRRIFSHMLANGNILYAKKTNLKVLKGVAIKNLTGKTTYNKDEILMHLYSIEDFYGEVLRFYKKGDIFSFEQNINLLVNNAIECLLKIKGEYLVRVNELQGVIKKSDLKFYKALEAIYYSRNNADKVKNLNKLVERIQVLTKGSLPKEWKVR